MRQLWHWKSSSTQGSKIRVSMGCEAKITSYMKINEVLYQVSVEEESTVPDYKLCQCYWSEESEGLDSEVGSIASNGSTHSGSRNFEVGRKVAEENLMVELRNAQPSSEQGHRRSEPICTVGGSEALSARPLSPLSAPIILGKDDLGAISPTTLSRADVDKRIGPSELAQDGLVYATHAKMEGRCRSKNLLETPSKSGPIIYGEEKLWNGSFGRLPIPKNFISLDESEQRVLSGEVKITSHHVKARNRVTIVPPLTRSRLRRRIGGFQRARRNW